MNIKKQGVKENKVYYALLIETQSNVTLINICSSLTWKLHMVPPSEVSVLLNLRIQI
jgi:hypothetical protein